MDMIDPFGRTITYLRVSVTDRCDFRCTYCMAEDMAFLPKKDLLSLEELERLLLDVARGPSQLTPEDLASLRQRIEEKGVLFKVRVIGANLRERGELPGPPTLERKRT